MMDQLTSRINMAVAFGGTIVGLVGFAYAYGILPRVWPGLALLGVIYGIALYMSFTSSRDLERRRALVAELKAKERALAEETRSLLREKIEEIGRRARRARTERRLDALRWGQYGLRKRRRSS